MTSNLTAGIVTFHRSWNYGACLQAFATIDVLKTLGVEAVCIDYSNAVERQKTAMEFAKSRQVKAAFVTGAKNVVLGRRRYSEKAFRGFHSLITRTDHSYATCEDLKDISFDVLVSGSDQIWNPVITGGLDEVFFLNFGRASKRIALASSGGSHNFTSEELVKIKPWLSKYQFIGVREEHLYKQLKSVVSVPVKTLLDPTLLMNVEAWRALERRPKNAPANTPYILVFTLKSNSKEDELFWRRCGYSLKLPVWRVLNNAFPMHGLDKVFLGATPEELLWLIDHARFVITDSFHGTAFSLNFGVPFVTLPSKTGNNERVANLLRFAGVPDRQIGYNDDIVFEYNANAAQIKLHQKRESDLASIAVVLGKDDANGKH